MPKRSPTQLRPITITPHYLVHPEGSALITWGDTKVICTASLEDKAPPWMAGKGKGWVTAEYDMLPRATGTRRPRDSQKGKLNGRTQEISRLIGRALRAVIDCDALGERTITVDCDVIQADGGTRTASITGAYVAMALAVGVLQKRGKITGNPLREPVAAVSVGMVDHQVYLDLDYTLDSNAQVDMNVVMTGSGNLVEVQGTGEKAVFNREQLDTMLDYAFNALPALRDLQQRAIEVPYSPNAAAVTT